MSFAGYITLNESVHANPAMGQKIANSFSFSGASGDFWQSINGYCMLIEARSSITGDEEEPKQFPFVDQLSGISIAFDGQLYNAAFLVRELSHAGHHVEAATDHELIAAAYKQWGICLVDRLEGTFAFALYDDKRKEFFLVRDHSGERPLFIWQSSSIFSFASHIKSLWDFPWIKRSVSYNQLRSYVLQGYVTAPLTWYDQIYHLPAGSYVHINAQQQVMVKSYTKKSSLLFDASADVMDYMRFLVDKRVLEGSAVTTMLSGSASSTILVSLLGQKVSKLSTYYLFFDNGQKATNEFLCARRLARYFGTEHYEFSVDEKEAFEYAQLMHNALPEPCADMYALANFISYHLIKKEIAVPLLFCDYGLSQRIESYVRVAVSTMLVRLRHVIHKDEKAMMLQQIPTHQQHDAWATMLINSTKHGALDTVHESCLKRSYEPAHAVGLTVHAPFVDALLKTYIKKPSLFTHLVKGTHYQLDILAQALVPSVLFYRQHVPMVMSVAYWFKEGTFFKNHFKDLIHQSGTIQQMLNIPYVRNMLVLHEQGRSDYSKQLWLLYQLLATDNIGSTDASLLL